MFLDETDPKVELVFLRTCQECGHQQKAKRPDPSKELSDSYRNSTCRKCGSEALDYGSERRMLK
jgi:hypothetical protein